MARTSPRKAEVDCHIGHIFMIIAAFLASFSQKMTIIIFSKVTKDDYKEPKVLERMQKAPNRLGDSWYSSKHHCCEAGILMLLLHFNQWQQPSLALFDFSEPIFCVLWGSSWPWSILYPLLMPHPLNCPNFPWRPLSSRVFAESLQKIPVQWFCCRHDVLQTF